MRYAFADCVLDIDRRVLTRAGQDVPVEPQVFDLLATLVANAGRVLSKDALIESVWGGRIVSDAAISARVSAARAAVGDSGKTQAVIRTVQRRGFEIVTDVTTSGESTAKQALPAAHQVVRYTTSRDGTQIAYAISGEGPPLMRAGHFLTHLEKDWEGSVFSPCVKAFGERHRLIRFDQRGTGLSQSMVRELSIDAYAEDMLAVADAAGLDHFPIFATSQGTAVSIHFAVHHPDRVSRMVFFGGFARGRAKRDDTYSKDEAEAMMTLIRMGWGKPESAFMSAFVSLFCPGATREERASLVESQLASATPEMAARVRMAIDDFDVTDLLPRVHVPTLVIHASNDALHPVSEGRLLAANIPGAEFKLVDSSNHVFLKSTPEWSTIMEASLEFLARDRPPQ